MATILGGIKIVLDTGMKGDYKAVTNMLDVTGFCDNWNGNKESISTWLGFLTNPESDHPEYYDPRYGRIKNNNDNYEYFRI